MAEVNPNTLTDDQLIKLATNMPIDLSDATGMPQAGITHYRTLPFLSSVGISSEEPSYGMGGTIEPEYEQNDEAFFRRILVVGEPTSVADLCLAWNIRAQRMPIWHFPVFVAPDWLKREDVVRNIDWAFHSQTGGAAEPP
ncbi:MAG: hypothetical protein M1358_15340, partial [Chloroflexi bacterium]|nr:hypothetical protein [Chloroflexota bacterium]